MGNKGKHQPSDHPTPFVSRLTWGVAVALYVDTLRAAQRSPGTIRLHRHYLRHLEDFARSPMRATTATLRRALSRSSWKPETRKSARSVYVSFYSWAVDDGYLEHSPADRLKPVRVPSTEARPIPDHVYRSALLLADERERWMLKLGRLGALRCCEIAAIHTDNLVGRRLYVTGKGGKQRIVPIHDDELLVAIATADGWLFPNGRGTHLSEGHVSKLIGQVLPGKWTAHTLRHGWGTASYAATNDLLAVGRVMGHSRPETTQRYVLLGDERLDVVVRAGAVSA